MTDEDEKELHRLCGALEHLESLTVSDSLEREALRKAGFALGLSFIHGNRKKLETLYENPPLTDEQLAHLRSLRINPEAESE